MWVNGGFAFFGEWPSLVGGGGDGPGLDMSQGCHNVARFSSTYVYENGCGWIPRSLVSPPPR